ncbi:flagellar hook-basal body complex protein FliE [Magnetofaba australis]|uniref:Flagellar hook-basal body complex protein FliE n=1 Tax=Magnetofaba australis IT-1 TaxID=1434232 RepID=A0A1Y2K2P5_9PROT|nr:flagellar hook-basal body complex protein FliE [Magnetofaba australis]OSM01454.1 putative flagellar hook-basal body complex subunit FliE [Magnetofaba australis IT-1]
MNVNINPLPNLNALTQGMSQTASTGKGPWEEFSVMLGKQIKETARLQTEAKDLGKRAMLGNAGVDLHEAQIASSQAELHLRLLVQVRNKAVEVYKEVMNMPV